MKFLLPVVCSLLLVGCSDSTTAETAVAPQNEAQVQTAPPAAAPEINTSVDTPNAVAAPEETPKAAPTATPSVAKTENTPTPVPAPAAKATTATVDAGAIYGQKCASCHGIKAEKSALGKSQVIAGFSEQQIKDALRGYQNGTYGKEMKALMQGQAKPLSSEQIDAIAHYISAL